MFYLLAWLLIGLVFSVYLLVVHWCDIRGQRPISSALQVMAIFAVATLISPFALVFFILDVFFG